MELKYHLKCKRKKQMKSDEVWSVVFKEFEVNVVKSGNSSTVTSNSYKSKLDCGHLTLQLL